MTRQKKAHFSIAMTNRSVLFLNSTNPTYSQSLLFYSAWFWALQGRKVLYISPEPIQALPPRLWGDDLANTEIFRRIVFMYLPDTQHLAKQMLSSVKQAEPPTIIIVQSLEHYCEGKAEEVAKCCFILKNFGIISKSRTGMDVVLVAGFNNENSTVPREFKRFFIDVWRLVDDETRTKCFSLIKLSPATTHVLYFKENLVGNSAVLDKVFKQV